MLIGLHVPANGLNPTYVQAGQTPPPQCGGAAASPSNPMALPGSLCVFEIVRTNVNLGGGTYGDDNSYRLGVRYDFTIPTANQDARVQGTWAATGR